MTGSPPVARQIAERVESTLYPVMHERPGDKGGSLVWVRRTVKPDYHPDVDRVYELSKAWDKPFIICPFVLDGLKLYAEKDAYKILEAAARRIEAEQLEIVDDAS